jgi:hypothetical protein
MLDTSCCLKCIQYEQLFDSWLYSRLQLVIWQIFSFVLFYIIVERFEYWPLEHESELSRTWQRDRFTVGRKCFSLNRAPGYLNEDFLSFYSVSPRRIPGWFIRQAHIITDYIPIPFNSSYAMIFKPHSTAHKSISWSSIIKHVPITSCLQNILLI